MVRVLRGRIFYCYGHRMKFVGRVKNGMTRDNVNAIAQRWLEERKWK